MFQLFFISLLLREISLSFQISCPDVTRRPRARKKLHHLRNNFLFVENVDSSEESGQTSRQIPHSYECPFKWDRDDDPARLPRFMTKAVCRDCKHYCLPVHYSQKGLVRKCDVRTGEVVWKWITVELPVAFVFNAYSGWGVISFVKALILQLIGHAK